MNPELDDEELELTEFWMSQNGHKPNTIIDSSQLPVTDTAAEQEVIKETTVYVAQ